MSAFYNNTSAPPETGVLNVPLNFGTAVNCFFLLSQDQNVLSSPVFGIKAQDRVPMTWFATDISTSMSDVTDEVDNTITASVSAAIASRSSASQTVTITNFVTVSSSTRPTPSLILTAGDDGSASYPKKRPNVTLPYDKEQRSYYAETVDCLDNALDFKQECWIALNLSIWVPAWVSPQWYQTRQKRT